MTEKKAAKEPAVRRLYRVPDAVGEPHLVNATSAAQAIVHVYKPLVRVATQQDLIAMRAVDVEEAA